MKSGIPLRNIGLGLSLLTFLPACASMNGFFRSDSGLDQVDDLLTRIERVHVESEISKETGHEALTSLHSMLAPDFSGDLVVAFDDFVEAIETSEAQAGELDATVEPMMRTAAAFFEQWATDLEAFSSDSMRQRSQTRMSATRDRYEAILEAVEPARANYEAFNSVLRDHALYLENDFNAESVATIEGELRALNKLGEQLDSAFDACLEASEEYVQAAALPLTPGVQPSSEDVASREDS